MAVLGLPFTVLSTADGFISGFVEVPGPQNANNVTIETFSDIDPNLQVDPSRPALFHVRQSNFGDLNPDHGFNDQFSTQLIQYIVRVGGTQTNPHQAVNLRLRLRRIDKDSGWGQSLRIDVLLKQ